MRPYVFHFRRVPSSKGMILDRPQPEASPLGGATIIYDPDSNAFAFTACSAKDHFRKKLGISISQGRLNLFKNPTSSRCKDAIPFNNLGRLKDMRSESIKWNGIITGWQGKKDERSEVMQAAKKIAEAIYDSCFKLSVCE